MSKVPRPPNSIVIARLCFCPYICQIVLTNLSDNSHQTCSFTPYMTICKYWIWGCPYPHKAVLDYTFHCNTNLVWLTLTFITAKTSLFLSLFIFFAKYILASIKAFGTWTHRHLGDVAIFTQWNRTYWVLQLQSGHRLESMSTTVRMATRIPSNWLPSHLMSRLSTRPPVSVYQRLNLSHSPCIYKSLKYNMANNAIHCLITLKWWSKIICIDLQMFWQVSLLDH